MRAKEIVGGLAIGAAAVGLVVALRPIAVKTESDAKPPVRCYAIVEIHPELGVAITFNGCSGAFGLSQFPMGISKQGM